MGSDLLEIIFALLAFILPLVFAALIVYWQTQPGPGKRNRFRR